MRPQRGLPPTADADETLHEDHGEINGQMAHRGEDYVPPEGGGDHVMNGQTQGSRAADPLPLHQADGAFLRDLAQDVPLLFQGSHVGKALNVIHGEGGGLHGLQSVGVILQGIVGELSRGLAKTDSQSRCAASSSGCR